MKNRHFLSNFYMGLVIAGLLLGLLAACGDNPTNQAAIGGQVLPNTAAPKPTNTIAPQLTATPAPQETIDTRPAITAWDPKVPYPTATPYPSRQPAPGNIPVFGTTVNVHGKVSNAEAQQKFLDAYRQGKPGQWEYVLYTIEGAPISNQFAYRGNDRQFTVSVDNTRDGFAGPDNQKIEEYTCQALTQSSKSLEFQSCIDRKGNKTTGWGLPLA